MKELVRRGHDVSVLARGVTRAQLPEEVSLVTGDRHNSQDLARARSLNVNAVIDINAYTREETQAVINTFDSVISRFVHLSTLSVCREIDRLPLVESDALVTDPTAGYAYDKAECERALRWAYTTTGFPFVSVRPAVVFGPRDRISRENYYLKRIVADDPVIVPGTGATPIFAVYVKDLAEVLANALESEGVSGAAYHLSQSEIVSINDHIANIAQIAGCEADFVEIPARLLERLGFNLQQFPYYTGGRIVVCDTGAATRDLGFEPTPYLRALRETIEYFLALGPEGQPSIEDRFQPLIPRQRERTLVERYRASTSALEDRLTDQWLNEAMPGM